MCEPRVLCKGDDSGALLSLESCPSSSIPLISFVRYTRDVCLRVPITYWRLLQGGDIPDLRVQYWHSDLHVSVSTVMLHLLIRTPGSTSKTRRFGSTSINRRRGAVRSSGRCTSPTITRWCTSTSISTSVTRPLCLVPLCFCPQISSRSSNASF